ncbi:MAG: copper oxidase, partial [Actinomycetota bacterium]
MAVLLLVIAFHRWVPEARWVMVHLVTLGLVTNSILLWSQHFTESLLKNRLPESARPRQLARVGLLNAGIVLLVAGTVTAWWWLSALAATAVGAAVAWHGAALLQQLRTALPSRFAVTVRYYVAAAFLLPVGAVLGAALAAGLPDPWHARALFAHEVVNVLGFVGLTVAGTLLTLWPTILRTRMPEDSVQIGTRSLPLLAGGVVVAAAAALLGTTALAVAGLVGYAAGLAGVVVLMARSAARSRPADYAGFSVAAGVVWWAATVVAAGAVLVRDGLDPAALGRLTVPFVAGFLAQVLLGAMTYLLPVTMGGGPATVRAAHRAIHRAAAFRVVVINLCVLLFALPPGALPSWVRAVVSLLGAAAFFAFVPLMVSSARISVAG